MTISILYYLRNEYNLRNEYSQQTHTCYNIIYIANCVNIIFAVTPNSPLNFSQISLFVSSVGMPKLIDFPER